MAILAADVVGYSRLMGEDETGTLSRLIALQESLVRPKVESYGGRVFKLMGDGILAEFTSVVEAVNCAVEIQTEMAAITAEESEQNKIAYRIGVNLGDVIAEGNDIYGDGVNVAARIEALAPPGGICITRSVRDQIRDRLAIDLEDLGEIEVKNIARPVRVFRVCDETSATGGSAPAGASLARLLPRYRSSVAMVLLLCLVIGVSIFLLRLWGPASEQAGLKQTPPDAPDKPSIAVLPFSNLSADETQEYFADGLTDDLIIDLSKVSGLFVIARNSVFSLKGRAGSIEEIAQQLGVRYVVEGSVRRSGNRIRVNAKLVNGTNGRHIWAERYDRQIVDLFAVQDELVSRIVSALAVTLTQTEQTTLASRPAPKLAAYDLYLKAREGYFSRDQVRMRESLGLYAKAWEIDPGFARAYAGYAQLAADIWRLASLRDAMSGATAFQVAESAARKALSLDPTLAEAYSVLALMRMVESDHKESVRLAKQAVALDPNGADTYTALAIVLIYSNQRVAALEAMRTAVRLNPRPTPYHSTYFGLALVLNERYGEAIAVLEPIADTRDRGIADAPREILAMAYAEAGRLRQARIEVKAMLAAEPYVNLAYYRVRYDHHASHETLHRRLGALRKAGMPAWPFGFQPGTLRRLSAVEIADMIASKTWTGNDSGRAKFIQEFASDGNTVYAGEGTLFNGLAFVKGGELCERFNGFMLGRDLCGPVFEKSVGASETKHRYFYVNSTTVREFSLAN